MTQRLSWRGLGTPEFLVGALLVIMVALGLGLIARLGQLNWLLLYLLASSITVILLRWLPVEPGALLSRRPARRALVLLMAGICCLLAAIPNGLAAWYVLPILALICCNVLLGRATQRVSAAPDREVDEWQEEMRNRAHLVGYRLLAIFVLGLAGAYLGSYITRAWLAQSFGIWVVVAELLLFLPAMVLAWEQPDPVVEPVWRSVRTTWLRRAVFAALAFELLLPVLASLALLVVPPQISTTVRAASRESRGCSYLGATETVGWVLQATLPISAEVCWTGARAFEQWGMNESDCATAMTSGLLAKTVSCRRKVLADGTLYFTYTTRLVSPAVPFVGRDVPITVAVSRTGRLLEFP